MIGNIKNFKEFPLRQMGEESYRLRTIDTVDTMGGKTSQTEDEIEVRVIFANITAKDLKIHEMGLAVPGDMKLYFDAEQDIIEGDTLLRGNVKWHVDKIVSQYAGMYSVALLKNMSLSGSE